ncbi:MAG: TlpA family protein disulfide reductase, partial [Syntrophothermus sp.]
LTRLHTGTVAPGFEIPDREKKMVRLADFKGKAVMLIFWTAYCQECIAIMEKIKPLADQFADRVQFVSISADKSFSKMNMFLKMKKNFTWTFLHIGESIDLLKDYNVRSYPLLVLIDKDGMIYEYAAPLPGEGLEAEITKMLNP